MHEPDQPPGRVHRRSARGARASRHRAAGRRGQRAIAMRASGGAARERRAAQRAGDRLAALREQGCAAARSGTLEDPAAALVERWTVGAVAGGAALVDVEVRWRAPAGQRVARCCGAASCAETRAGMSLVELLVALSLGGIVLAAAASSMLRQQRGVRWIEGLTRRGARSCAPCCASSPTSSRCSTRRPATSRRGRRAIPRCSFAPSSRRRSRATARLRHAAAREPPRPPLAGAARAPQPVTRSGLPRRRSVGALARS